MAPPLQVDDPIPTEMVKNMKDTNKNSNDCPESRLAPSRGLPKVLAAASGATVAVLMLASAGWERQHPSIAADWTLQAAKSVRFLANEPMANGTEAEAVNETAGNLTALWGGWRWGGSCRQYGCQSSYRWGQTCSCAPSCERIGLCCSDYNQVCNAQRGSCSYYGCANWYDPDRYCQCNEACRDYGSCCSDYSAVCRAPAPAPPPPPPPPAPAHSPAGSCQAYGCHTTYHPEFSCQCNSACVNYGNCCGDFQSVCQAPAPQPSPQPAPQPAPAPVPDPPPAHTTPSDGRLYTFYIYRAQSDDSYPPKNCNAANLVGVMWYLQHEVVIKDPPKFGISRILRYKIQTRAPASLLEKGMNFGVRYAYDSQKCTGPGKCDPMYAQYGHFVGCNKFESNYPYPTEASQYPGYSGGIWYSLPGEGECSGVPTGAPDCTYSYTWPPDVITLEELQGHRGQQFWDHGTNEHANQRKIEELEDLFREKFPHSEQLSDPTCDFSYSNFWN